MRAVVLLAVAAAAPLLVREGMRAGARRPGRDVSRDQWGRPTLRWIVTVVARARGRRRERSEAARRQHEIPLVAQLLRMAVSSGLTIPQALAHVAEVAPPATRLHLAEAVRALELGAGTQAALTRLATRAPDLDRLAEALSAAADLGIEAGDALCAVGDDALGVWLRQAQTQARTVPVRLLFPLVFLVLPAFALLTVAPALLVGLAA